MEGLQIEEEGLTDYFRKKTKQSPPVNNTQKYNDPTGDVYINQNAHKNGQVLKGASSLNSYAPTAISENDSLKENANNKILTVISQDIKITANDNFNDTATTRMPTNLGRSTAKRKKRHDSRRKHKTK